MDGWIIHGFLIIVHGQCPWTTSLSSIHGQLPWTIILSSKGDMVSYKSYSRSNNISQSPWVVPDPICSPEHGRSLWTNWRWTNFSPSYQLLLLLLLLLFWFWNYWDKFGVVILNVFFTSSPLWRLLWFEKEIGVAFAICGMWKSLGKNLNNFLIC